MNVFFFSWIFFVLSLQLIAAPSQKNLVEISLPNEHPAYAVLETLFHGELSHRLHLFDNYDTLKAAGFIPRAQFDPKYPNAILVAAHPYLPGYLIKKYPNHLSPSWQLKKYKARIQGARKIADYLEDHHFQHLIVPKKWLYRLPNEFDHGKSKGSTYLLIVEECHILLQEETLKKYEEMDFSFIKELCYLLHDLRGCDAAPKNFPFTKEGKIAAIDTEHLGKTRRDFLISLLQYFNREHIPKAEALWKQLETIHN